MIRLIRRIRRKLRQMRYHSANRQRTAWGVARDRLLAISFAASLPAMLIAERVVVRPVPMQEHPGDLFQDRGSSLVATIAAPDLMGKVRPPELPMYGEFVLVIETAQRGWPYATLRSPERIRLDLNAFDRPDRVRDAVLPADSPVRAAIDAALTARSPDRLRDVWSNPRAGEGSATRLWRATLASLALWWLMLVAVSWTGLLAARIIALVVYDQRTQRLSTRLARGHCPTCDYDLRGLEFHARCPECGALVE